MSKISHFYVCVLLLTVTLCVSAVWGSLSVNAARRTGIPREVFRQLDAAMSQAGRYAALYQHTLDSLGNLGVEACASGDLERAWKIYMETAERYRSFNTDSALLYSMRAEQVAQRQGDVSHAQLSRLIEISSLSTAGLFADARILLDSIAIQPMTPEVRIAYWKSARMFYSYQGVYVEGQEYFSRQCRRYCMTYSDSLMLHLPAGDPLRIFLECERKVNEGQYESAGRELKRMVLNLTESDNFYAMFSFQLAEVYRHRHDEQNYVLWLSRAAAGDIKANVREGLALPTLGIFLYESGYLNEAFTYMNFALEDATRGHARMRTVAIANLMPVIDAAYKEKISASRDQLIVYLLTVVLLLAVSIGLLWVLWRQKAAARESQRRLAVQARAQNTYMGHFIGLCSSYADRFESLVNMVNRKLAAGEASELQKMIKAGKFAEGREDNFDDMFDKAFLDIYPDFVTRFNVLLKPGEQLSLRQGELLTTELRIYALIRLGVDESQRIAQILHCSVSTVYSYRNRMRNRAIDRDNFEQAVRDMGRNDND
ncbi:MAG: hypothetical protein K2K26_08575 [Muribaculaceae bacterium]|nr:hypothetical protein [Muribaculaceae bacterium]